ncbi:MAG TPA: outer membrane beta-barrel protein [Bradyrhizobium sp.]
MKKLLLLSSAVIAAGPALAADLPVKAPPMAAALPYSWTGCHVGGHIGAGWDRTTYSDPGTLSPLLLGGTGIIQNFAPAGASFSSNGDGAVLGGVQAGCDYQFASHWVIGFGGDISWTNINSLANDPFFNGKNGRPIGLSARTDEIATLTGRVGYAWDKVLFYGKGGAAYAHDKYSSNNAGGINNAVFGCGGPAPPDCAVAGSADRWGWTAGVGVEWAFATNWSAMIEYDHYGFDTKTISMSVTNSTFPVVPANLNVRHDIDTVKVGINYRFWSSGPVVARY